MDAIVIDTVFVEDLQNGDIINTEYGLDEVFAVSEHDGIVRVVLQSDIDESVLFDYGERIDIYGYAVVEI